MSSFAAAVGLSSLAAEPHEARRRSVTTVLLHRVSEHAAAKGHGMYEPEGSERVTRGSVSLADGGWWGAELSVGADDRVALLRLVRTGAGSDQPAHDTQAELLFPVAEADALVALVAGVVQHARRDGGLTPSGAA